MKPKHIIQVVAHINYLLSDHRTTKITMQKIHQIVCWMILLVLIVSICMAREMAAMDDRGYESEFKLKLLKLLRRDNQCPPIC